MGLAGLSQIDARLHLAFKILNTGVVAAFDLECISDQLNDQFHMSYVSYVVLCIYFTVVIISLFYIICFICLHLSNSYEVINCIVSAVHYTQTFHSICNNVHFVIFLKLTFLPTHASVTN